MARINLIPWREELRQQKKKDFVAAMGLSAVATVGFLILSHMYVAELIDRQNQRNSLLNAEIKKLDVEIAKILNIEETKKKLLAKIDVIQKLQESRPEIVHLFDEVPKTAPDGVYLTKMTLTGSTLTFEGKTQSNARVSAFMRAIEASQWLKDPKVVVIQAQEKNQDPDKLSDFTLNATQGGKKAEQPS